MTDQEKAEYKSLIHKWNCSDITPEQEERLKVLDRIAMPVPHDYAASTAIDKLLDALDVLYQYANDSGKFQRPTYAAKVVETWLKKNRL